MRLILAAIAALGMIAVKADPVRIADVNSRVETYGLNPSDMVKVGGRLYFAGEDRVHGKELWMSDGTAAGTRLVGDLNVGQSGSFPSMLRAVGDRLFFFANDAQHGNELWVTDEQEARMVGDLREGSLGYDPKQAVEAGGLFYFAEGPNSGLHGFLGYGLWRSDGTAEGTWLINPVQMSDWFFRPFNRPTLLTAMDDGLFFVSNGRFLCWTRGTAADTVQLADPGEGATIISLATDRGRLWFTVNRSGAKELWKWSEDTAVKIADLPHGAVSNDLLAARRGRVYFLSMDLENGGGLWTSDGTITVRVAWKSSRRSAVVGSESSAPSGSRAAGALAW